MSDGLEKDQDPLDSNWLTQFENQCIENDNDTRSVIEERIASDNERAAQKLWLSFQNSASCISLLFKEGSNQNCVWIPFQNAASSVTTLYKDGMEVMKKCFEMGKQHGQCKRNEEIISWTRRHRRHLRREEVLAFLCGISPPPHPTPHKHRTPSSISRANCRLSGDRSSPRHSSPRLPSPAEPAVVEHRVDMQPFCDALALQGLNGAMSNFGIRTGSASQDTGTGANGEDIHGFVLEELSRRRLSDNRKRNSTATSDSNLDSPTRKRSRLL